MTLTVCAKCASHIFAHEKQCPHCGVNRCKTNRSYTGKRATLTLLMGLATLTACGEDDKTDSSAEPATEPASEPDTQPAYGVVDSGDPEPESQPEYGVFDADGDGWEEGIDCDDNNPNTYPGSAELDSTEDCMTDADGDGFGDANAQSPVVAGTDCDDTNPDVNTAATETAGDSIDSNCNGNDDD